jgi:L-amino acid N-acyltransferase YncA
LGEGPAIAADGVEAGVTAPYRIRPAVDEDLPLVVQTYVREARRALRASELPPTWDAVGERFVAECYLRGLVSVACAVSDESQILGYCLADRRGSEAVLHWLYVRGPFRGWGVAQAMAAHATRGCEVVTVTHTASAWQRAQVRARGWRASDRLPWLWLLGLDEEEARV